MTKICFIAASEKGIPLAIHALPSFIKPPPRKKILPYFMHVLFSSDGSGVLKGKRGVDGLGGGVVADPAARCARLTHVSRTTMSHLSVVNRGCQPVIGDKLW